MASSKSDMIAFLIAAHSDPMQLRRLVLALRAPWTLFWIHIDAKVPIEPFRFALADIEEVTFLEARTAVHWGGWSQVEATLKLLNAALASKANVTRFALLSGTCYPVRSNAALADFLFSRNVEYISLTRMPDAAAQKPLTRLSRWRFEGGSRTGGIKAAGVRMVNELLHLGPRRDLVAYLGHFTPHAGGSWWVLTRGAIEAVLETARDNPSLTNLFRYSECPDESFIHTILAYCMPSERIEPSLTYADWSMGRGSPSEINETHLQYLLSERGRNASSAPVFFARKLSADRTEIVALIEKVRQDDSLSRSHFETRSAFVPKMRRVVGQ